MRSLYDEFDEFDFDFAGNGKAMRFLREELEEQRRQARRRVSGPGKKKHRHIEEDDDYSDFDDYDEYADYDDYDDDRWNS